MHLQPTLQELEKRFRSLVEKHMYAHFRYQNVFVLDIGAKKKTETIGFDAAFAITWVDANLFITMLKSQINAYFRMRLVLSPNPKLCRHKLLDMRSGT